jgi:NhaP-type Na+/H+ and K+/H+ antiporter
VTISKNARAAGKTVREITSERRFPRDWLITGIFRKRDGQLIIPTGTERLFPWDQILLCGAAASTKEVADYFEITRWLGAIIGRRIRDTTQDKVEQQAQNEIDTAIEKAGETDEVFPD